MTIQDYAAARTKYETDYKACAITSEVLGPAAHKLVHYALGLSTEALELIGAIKAQKPMASQLEELGDICWFAAGACDVLGRWPTDEQINAAPKTGAFELAAMCEEFASRIKAGLFYGRIAKPCDPYQHSWQLMPAAILARTLAIANAQTTLGRNALLATNIQKLEVRYNKGSFNAAAFINRNTAAELAAIGNVPLTSESVAPAAKAPVTKPPANREVITNPNIKIPAPATKDFTLITDKELKTMLSTPETQRPRSLSALLGRQPTQGHEQGALPQQPAGELPPADPGAPEGEG